MKHPTNKSTNHNSISFSFLFLVLILILPILNCDNAEDAQVIDTYWKTESPELHGFNSQKLGKIIDQATTSKNFYALLVIRNNKIILEKYFNKKNAHSLFHVRSITKNVTSSLTGIAIEENIFESLDTKIMAYYPDHITEANEPIQIKHLLNMTSGLQWSENAELDQFLQHKIQDPISNILARESVSVPGSYFNYNTILPHIVGQAISAESGMSYKKFAQEKLLTPHGIVDFDRDKDPNNQEWGGVGLKVTAKDLAKFGQLYLNGGIWQGKQIIPKDWISLSQEPQINLTNSNFNYSLYWWLSKNYTDRFFYGRGYGGQALMIVPNKNLIVIALQKHEVTFEDDNSQWASFYDKIFMPIYQSAN